MKTAILQNGKNNQNGSIGEAIRIARQKLGMTQEQLAEASGIHRQWIGRWERNRATPNTNEWQVLKAILEIRHVPNR